MQQEKVSNIIDKTIIEKGLNNGDSLLSINRELHKRVYIIFNIVQDEYQTLDRFLKVDITNKSVKEKYAYFFIKHAAKRINDIHWMFDKKEVLKKYNNIQLFGLVKLKERLQNES